MSNKIIKEGLKLFGKIIIEASGEIIKGEMSDYIDNMKTRKDNFNKIKKATEEKCIELEKETQELKKQKSYLIDKINTTEILSELDLLNEKLQIINSNISNNQTEQELLRDIELKDIQIENEKSNSPGVKILIGAVSTVVGVCTFCVYLDSKNNVENITVKTIEDCKKLVR